MSIKIDSIKKEISLKLQNVHPRLKDFSALLDWPLILGKQCIYILDWRHGTLTYSRGLEAMLGYDPTNGEANSGVFNFHPDDETFVNRIIRGITLHCIQTNVSGKGEFLNLTYRLRKKDGSFIKVLRQSGAYEIDEAGRMISNWSYLTDISFISNQNKVEWDIYANELNVADFHQRVYEEFSGFFTQRELDIIKAIKLGYTNMQISEHLYISPHTVSTHRKNIFRKSQCSNVRELLAFCSRIGV